MNIYDIEVIDINGKPRVMSEFKGKKLLIVNTASNCGLTPQYEELQKLQDEFRDELVVLAFPCNQFGAQEPGESQEIKDFCDLRFNITFPLFTKIEVNGSNTHPLFKLLKDQLPGALGINSIKWNFTKFLIDSDGTPIKRFAPTTSPKEIKKYL